VAEVFISVYPKSIGPGEHGTFYASVTASDGSIIPAWLVQWTIVDTTVATMGGPDQDGRSFAVPKRDGTTEIIGTCGDQTGHATVTVTGVGDSASPTDSAGSPASVHVTLDAASLHPGETAQAAVSAVDAEGVHMHLDSVAWSSSNPAVATVSAVGAVTAHAEGSANIQATVIGTTGSAALEVASASTPTTPTTPGNLPPTSGVSAALPVLPQAGVPDAQFTQPSGNTIRASNYPDLQGALNAARPGDLVLLPAGASYYGNFILPDNGGGSSGNCTTWTTVMTEGSIPSPGVRVTPSSASSYAKLLTPNVDAALRTNPRASCWRVVGVEMAVAPSFNGLHYGLVLFGNGDVSSLDQQPHGIVFDRVYIHGQSSTNLIRCVALNSIRSAIINSWISDCHARGFDSQAIAGWDGPGPYLIENNYLEAAGENIMFGGADPRIQNLVPSDITIRRNHLYKQTSWKGMWTVKNLFELKSARRLLIEGNVFENNWADAQTGMAIVIKSANDGGTGPWQGTTDVTFRSNVVRNSPQGLNIAARPEENPVVTVARVLVDNNLFENIGSFNGTVSGNMLILLNELKDVTISSNTMIHNTTLSGMLAVMDYASGAARNVVIRDNVATKGGPWGALVYSGAQIGTQSMNALAGSSWAFDRNVVIGLDADIVAIHPPTSWYAPTMSSVGFVNYSGGDYRLGSGSPYKGKATNGRDPGVDFDLLLQLTTGVTSRSAKSRRTNVVSGARQLLARPVPFRQRLDDAARGMAVPSIRNPSLSAATIQRSNVSTKVGRVRNERVRSLGDGDRTFRVRAERETRHA
jgi:hypothetical protein